MSELLANVTETDLRTLAKALRSGRLSFPPSAVALQRFVSSEACNEAAGAMKQLAILELTPIQVAGILEVLASDRAHRGLPEGIVDLVTSGPDGVGANRDTGVVVRELFANAQKSVLVAGYAVYQGQLVFQALAERMLEVPSLSVNMFLDIQRTHGDTTSALELVRRFADRFKRQQWPDGYPVPNLITTLVHWI